MSIPEKILQAGCDAYCAKFLNGLGSLGDGIEAAYLAIHEHADWVRAGPPAWTGEGLPPVGIDVEIHNKTGLSVVEGAEGFIGSKCTVMATFTNMHGYEIVSVEDDSGSCMCFRAHMCFPVRTPEQIAADERKAEIDAMYRIFYDAPGLASQEGIAALYDAGYRKQPTP